MALLGARPSAGRINVTDLLPTGEQYWVQLLQRLLLVGRPAQPPGPGMSAPVTVSLLVTYRAGVRRGTSSATAETHQIGVSGGQNPVLGGTEGIRTPDLLIANGSGLRADTCPGAT